MIIILIILLIILLLSGVVFLFAFYNANKKDVTYNLLTGEDYDKYSDEMINTIKTAEGIPYEEVFITSRDGLKLFGRLYLQNPAAPVHIQFHGYKGNGIRDFSGGMQIALRTGGNVIVVDQRAHGRSGGHVISFGIKERYDVLSWIDYARKSFGENTPIILEGISMGAATVLMASNLSLPDNVKGIVADCPFSSPFKIVADVAKKTVPCSWLLYPFIVSGAFLFGHFNIFKSSAEKSVSETKIPILLIHGTGDHYVPIEMSRKIYDANPDIVTKIEVEGAPHGLSYLKDNARYEKAFTDFVNRLV